MAILYNSFYRMMKNGTLQVMPAPVDADTPDAPWYAVKLAQMAKGLAQAGFSHILWPPLCKAQGGSANNADGYGKLDDYDIGSKDQAYSIPTRWGTAEQVRQAVAIGRSFGLGHLSDMVIHQYDGGNNGTYTYAGADGRTMNGRFPKHPSCFVGAPPRVQVDPVFDSNGNYAFGDMVSYVYSTPQNYMRDGMIAAIQWQLQTIGLDGFRLDDTKGENAAVTRTILDSPIISDAYCFGECFTGNPQELEAWVQQMNGRDATLDFGLHFALQAVCDDGASCHTLDGAGFTSLDPGHSITFVETADTDQSNGENITSNKLLAYAYLLAIEGTPMVYAGDYLPERYGLQPWIDNLVWIHRTFAFGQTITRYVDQSAIVLNRDGNGGVYGWSGGLLAAMNWDTWNTRPITCATSFGANVHLHDYTGHHADIWTDGDGNASFTIPSNAYASGESYLFFAPAGVEEAMAMTPRKTTQKLFGATDLDIAQARANTSSAVARVWAKDAPKVSILPETLGGAAVEDLDGWWSVVVTNPLAVDADFEATVTYEGKAL